MHAAAGTLTPNRLAVRPDQLVWGADTPPPGPSFSAAMEAHGYRAGQEKDFICFALSFPLVYPLRREKEDGFDLVKMIPGHAMAGAYGPRPCEVMMIGKMPGSEEHAESRYFVGPAGVILREALSKYQAPFNGWYVSNVARFMPPSGKSLKKHVIDECACYLYQEIEIVDPKYILLMGAEAVSWMFPNKSLKNLRGAFLDVRGRQVFCTLNPAAILYNAGQRQSFEDDISVFIAGVACADKPEKKPTSYYYLDSVEKLDQAVDEIISKGFNQLAVDCEWSGPDYLRGRLRTIQVSWAEGYALVVQLTDEKGRDCFRPSRYAALQALQRLIYRDGVEVCGHGFRADLPWLIDFGLTDILKYFTFDTMLAHHLLRENAEQALNSVALRTTDLGRYDLELKDWVSRSKIGKHEGFGTVPDRLLLPYAAKDADATTRTRCWLQRELSLPENAQFKKLYEEIVHPVTEAILEMEMTGLCADVDRMKELVHSYERKRNELTLAIRVETGKRHFNFRSYIQIQDLLFGEYGLKPVKTTDTHGGMDWDRFVRDHESHIRCASTDKETLGILATENKKFPVIRMLRDVKFIDQICKNFLRPPDEPDSIDDFEESFSKGLIAQVHSDGRIRPRISQLAATGRYRCFDPNLQNLPNRREKDYDRIFAPRYVPKIRSCFMVRPGYALIEADYVQAELFFQAWEANDSNMLEALTTPGRDLHSETAKESFKLDVFVGLRNGEAVDEVKEKYDGLRVGAKAITFGIMFGRGGMAISREVKEEGINLTVEDANNGIKTFFILYPGVEAYAEECDKQIREHWYIDNVYGRRRRFAATSDESQIAGYVREARNHPIQGGVADTLSRALINITKYRKTHRTDGRSLDFKLLLAIHDAVLIEAAPEDVEHIVRVMLPRCMSEQAVVPEHNSSLSIDVSIGLRWGEAATSRTEKGRKVIEELVSMGVSEDLF